MKVTPAVSERAISLLSVPAFSQWYLPHELALRMSIYNIAQPTGAMLSGAMQGALSTNLEGVLGRAGWRWAFLINVSPRVWRILQFSENSNFGNGGKTL